MSSSSKRDLLEEEVTRSVIGGFYAVHRELGFGFLEHVYALALERELTARGHRVAREVAVMVHYRGEPLTWQRLDMIVDEKIVLETKAGDRLQADAGSQLFSYLCGTSLEIGLLLHFGREAKFQRVIYENRLKRRSGV
jgi:GxxExxY protein